MLFSQSKKLLDLAERVLHSLDMKMLRIDGDVVGSKERQARIEQFNQ